ncbi:hypothetical protein JCM10021v2_001790 [Rhodotorula toruloides]
MAAFLHVKFGSGRPPEHAHQLPFAHEIEEDPTRTALHDSLKTDVQRSGVIRYLEQNFKEGSYVHDVVSSRESEHGMYALVCKNWARSVGDPKLHLSLYIYQDDRHVATWHAYTDRSISYSRTGDENDPPPDGAGADPYSTAEALEAAASRAPTPAPGSPDADRPRFNRPAAAPDSDEDGVEPPFETNGLSSKPASPASAEPDDSRSRTCDKRAIGESHDVEDSEDSPTTRKAAPSVQNPRARAARTYTLMAFYTLVRGNLDDHELDIPAGGETTLLEAKRRSASKDRSARRARHEPKDEGFDPKEVEKPAVPPPKPTAKAVLGEWLKSVGTLLKIEGELAAGEVEQKVLEHEVDDERARAQRKEERRLRREARAARRAARAKQEEEEEARKSRRSGRAAAEASDNEAGQTERKEEKKVDKRRDQEREREDAAVVSTRDDRSSRRSRRDPAEDKNLNGRPVRNVSPDSPAGDVRRERSSRHRHHGSSNVESPSELDDEEAPPSRRSRAMSVSATLDKGMQNLRKSVVDIVSNVSGTREDAKPPRHEEERRHREGDDDDNDDLDRRRRPPPAPGSSARYARAAYDREQSPPRSTFVQRDRKVDKEVENLPRRIIEDVEHIAAEGYRRTRHEVEEVEDKVRRVERRDDRRPQGSLNDPYSRIDLSSRRLSPLATGSNKHDPSALPPIVSPHSPIRIARAYASNESPIRPQPVRPASYRTTVSRPTSSAYRQNQRDKDESSDASRPAGRRARSPTPSDDEADYSRRLRQSAAQPPATASQGAPYRFPPPSSAPSSAAFSDGSFRRSDLDSTFDSEPESQHRNVRSAAPSPSLSPEPEPVKQRGRNLSFTRSKGESYDPFGSSSEESEDSEEEEREREREQERWGGGGGGSRTTVGDGARGGQPSWDRRNDTYGGENEEEVEERRPFSRTTVGKPPSHVPASASTASRMTIARPSTFSPTASSRSPYAGSYNDSYDSRFSPPSHSSSRYSPFFQDDDDDDDPRFSPSQSPAPYTNVDPSTSARTRMTVEVSGSAQTFGRFGAPVSRRAARRLGL